MIRIVSLRINALALLYQFLQIHLIDCPGNTLINLLSYVFRHTAASGYTTVLRIKCGTFYRLKTPLQHT